ncbi:MAG: hypothetical protein J5I92_16865 [Thiogranum sp.]|nr:hypothetical protein [Thiogranum sp.]
MHKYPFEKIKAEYPLQLNAVYPEFGSGWMGLIMSMLEELEASLTTDEFHAIRFRQIKSKFGGLRAYYVIARGARISDDAELKMREIIEKYNYISTNKCEICGGEGRRVMIDSWIVAMCNEHITERVIERGVKDCNKHLFHSINGVQLVKLDELSEADRFMFKDAVECVVSPPIEGYEYAFFYERYLELKSQDRARSEMESKYLRFRTSFNKQDQEDDDATGL